MPAAAYQAITPGKDEGRPRRSRRAADGPQDRVAGSDGHSDTTTIALSVARGLVLSRDARERSLPFGIFSDPAWDILVELFIADARGHRLSVTDVCTVGGISATTGQRYILRMSQLDLIVRLGDPGDRRRTLLELRPETRDTLGALLVRMAETVILGVSNLRSASQGGERSGKCGSLPREQY